MEIKSLSPWRNLKYDAPASLVVYLVAVPLSLGIAMASGAPLLSGVIAGIVGGLVVGILSGSPLGVSGAAAGLAVIVASAVDQLGSFPVFLSAVVLAGIFQILLGLLGGGFIGYYFPSSVIKGMLAGIGVIIFLKQIPHAVGYDQDYEGNLTFWQSDGQNTFSELLNMFGYLTLGPIIVAALSLGILLLWESSWIQNRKGVSQIPGPLAAVLCGVIFARLFASHSILGLQPDQLVSIPVLSSAEAFQGALVFPDFSQIFSQEVISLAVVLALVASIETLLCVEATDKLDPYQRVTPANRELYAQGLGNIITGLLGGLPVTQVIVRSSSNIQAGGRTKASCVLHGIWILLSLVLFPSLINSIPLASLAAILMVVGYKLAKPALFRQMFRLGGEEFIPFIITVLGLLFTDLLMGVAMGFGAALLAILWANYRHPFTTEAPKTQGEDCVTIRLAEDMSFLNKPELRRKLNDLPCDIKVLIDASNTRRMHPDIREIIDSFIVNAQTRNIGVDFTEAVNETKGLEAAGTKPIGD